MAKILTEEQKQFVLQGGVISGQDPETQQAYSEFVKAGQAGGTSITSESLTPIPQIPFESSIIPPVTDISGLEAKAATLPVTPKETEISETEKRLKELTDIISGKEVYKLEKEKEFGVVEAETTMEDLSRQLRDLQREQQITPLKVETEFRGRAGVGEQQRISAARNREIAIQALTLSSSIDAAQGLLSSANRKVERAMAEKYAKDEAEYKARSANYDMLIKSPETSRQDKERALKQKEADDKLADKRKEQKTKEENAQKKVNELIALNPAINTLQIDEMRKLTDETDVLIAATNMGLLLKKEEKLTGDVGEYFDIYGKKPTPEQLFEFKRKQAEATRESKIIGSAETGYLEYNPNTKKWNPIIISGTGEPIKSDDIATSNLPNEQKNSIILTELLKNKKIGQGTRTQLGNILGVINASEDLAEIGQAGKFTGVSPIRAILDFRIPLPFTDLTIPIPFRQTFKQKGTATVEGYLEAINLKVQQWASGAALTEAQTEQVGRFTPRVTDTDIKVREKLNNLINFMATQAKSQLQTEGITFEPQKVDLFEVIDLLEKVSPEQLEELKQAGLL